MDEDGFLITGNTVVTAAKTIAFMGDSFVESMYSHESDRFVAVAERQLLALGTVRRCVNASYSGSTTLQLLNNVLNKIYPALGPGGTIVLFRPTAIVIISM